MSARAVHVEAELASDAAYRARRDAGPGARIRDVRMCAESPGECWVVTLATQGWVSASCEYGDHADCPHTWLPVPEPRRCACPCHDQADQ